MWDRGLSIPAGRLLATYIRTNVRPFRRRKRLTRRVVAAALLLLLGFGGPKVWTTIRDIERLGLHRMALEDKAILTVPDVQEASESLGAPTISDPNVAPQEKDAVPTTEAPISETSPAETEAALLVGTRRWSGHSSAVGSRMLGALQKADLRRLA